MKKLTALGVILLVLVILLASVSCGGAKETPPPVPPGIPESGVVPAPQVSSPPGLGGFFDRGGTTSKGDSGTIQTTADQRMIVRTGQLSLVVNDITKARDDVTGLATGLNGYVVSSQIWGEGQDMRGIISIRVPDDKFESALSELRRLAVRVTTESTNSQDVTEEYTDLQSRLKNAEATEAQYLALLEKATNVEDILKIYERLSQVRSEIEQIKGRMQFLERTVSMSLITVSLTPATSGKPLATPGWSALEILKTAVRGIVIFGQWLLTAVIWVVVFSPLWGVILGIIYWKRRSLKTLFKG